MNPIVPAVRAGISRGGIELRQALTSREDMGYYIFTAIVFVVVLLLQRGATVEGTDLPLATLSLPGILGMQVVLGGFVGAASMLTVEREDGTLLRSKAVPYGMVGYLTGRVIAVSTSSVVGVLIVLIPGALLLERVTEGGLAGWLNLLWVLALGLLATMPWGAMVGSVFTNPQAVWGYCMLGVGSIVAISGIFYPIQALWGWVQGIAQVFPVYWLGLGMRSAILPDAAAAVEIGNSWRTPETVAVLAAWAAVGLLIAPGVLRRMARREAGSSVEVRRQKALQRV
jgi:ABC-2 type transport system permease protein